MLGQKKERVSKDKQEKIGFLKEKLEKDKQRWTPNPSPAKKKLDLHKSPSHCRNPWYLFSWHMKQGFLALSEWSLVWLAICLWGHLQSWKLKGVVLGNFPWQEVLGLVCFKVLGCFLLHRDSGSDLATGWQGGKFSVGFCGSNVGSLLSVTTQSPGSRLESPKGGSFVAQLISFPWEWIGSVPLAYLKNLTEVGPDLYFERQRGEGWQGASTTVCLPETSMVMLLHSLYSKRAPSPFRTTSNKSAREAYDVRTCPNNAWEKSGVAKILVFEKAVKEFFFFLAFLIWESTFLNALLKSLTVTECR